MKVFKNPIFMFILGLIVSGSVVYAATQINAENIKYDNTHNVKQKIDELYDIANFSDGKSDTINIPSDYAQSIYEYNCGFEPSFIYIKWSNGGSWVYLNGTTYTYFTADGHAYTSVNNAFDISSTGFGISLSNYPGLKGLTADIYAVK